MFLVWLCLYSRNKATSVWYNVQIHYIIHVSVTWAGFGSQLVYPMSVIWCSLIDIDPGNNFDQLWSSNYSLSVIKEVQPLSSISDKDACCFHEVEFLFCRHLPVNRRPILVNLLLKKLRFVLIIAIYMITGSEDICNLRYVIE
jgi:hypothetical protein